MMIPKSAPMNRRRFVQVGVSSLLIPCAGIVVARESGNPRSMAPDQFFFDDRFAEARRLAQERSGTSVPTPVQGDVTGFWTGGLASASLAKPLTLMGVTTESFYFCLKTLLVDHARVDAQVRRVDRDLHLWTIRTDNHKKGTMSWQSHFRPG
jgi:hypothetical protein